MVINYQDICKNIFSEREFIENSLLGIGVLQDDQIIYVNNTILKNFGYSLEEIQQKDFWMKVIHPDDLSIVKRQIEIKLKEKKNNTTRYKCRVLLKSGDFKWIEVFSKIFYHNNETAIIFTMIETPRPTPLIELSTNDLAKLNVVEELLKNFKIPYKIFKPVDMERKLGRKKEYIDEIKKSYEIFEKVINNLSDVTVEVNSEGTFTFLSPQSFDILGFHPKELIGLNAFDYVHPEDLSLIRTKMKEAIIKEEILYAEYRAYHKDGYYIPVATRGGVYKEQGDIKFIGVIRNITERKKLEEKLLASKAKYEDLSNDLKKRIHDDVIKIKELKEKFHHLLESTPYAVILMNFRGNIIECNTATLKLFKYEVDEIIGKNLLELIAFPSKSLSTLENAFERLIKGQ
ncbi:MAG: PAS domain S-box protein, partial [Promethearchaeota archaeon]